MSNIQLKNVDEDLHEAVRRRAADEGRSISDYVLDLIRRDLRSPRRHDWLRRALDRPVFPISNDELLEGRDRDRETGLR